MPNKKYKNCIQLNLNDIVENTKMFELSAMQRERRAEVISLIEL
jgi:hypothetical protein